MTAAFQYDEPELTDTAANVPTIADDPAAAALSMINNGPAPDCNQGDGQPGEESANANASPLDETATDTATIPEEGEPEESLEYGEEEYGELCRQADEDYALELQRLETEFAEAGRERALRADTLKDAKQSEKLALEVMRDFIAKGPKYPPKTRPRVVNQGEESNGAEQPTTLSVDSDVPYADPENLVATTPEHEAYYNTPTASLLADIDGLGKAKLERLVEVAPTCRDLVRLHIQAGRYHHGDLSELLPDGFGKKLGERIVERLLDKMPFVPPTPAAAKS